MGLLGFETFNNIPNVTEKNNKFLYGTVNDRFEVIRVPEGTYSIDDIYQYLSEHMGKNETLLVRMNNNTMRTEVKCSSDVDFNAENSIGQVMGFDRLVLERNEWHESEQPVNVLTVNSLVILCNLVSGSYKNGAPAHILHQFFPSVPPGYKIIERPQPIIYLPLLSDIISSIIIQVEDEHGNPVNFNSELVTVTLHLKSFE